MTSRLLTIGSDAFSLSLSLPETGLPEIVSLGRARGDDDTLIRLDRSSRINGMDAAVPSAVLLPTGGLGFFGWPAITGHRDGRDFTLAFAGWTVAEEEGATRLTATDTVAAIRLEITLAAKPGDVIAVSSRLTNLGEAPYQLDRLAAASFLAPEDPATLTTFTGMWGREFQLRQEALGTGLWLQESRRGRTSHDRYPTLFLSGARGGIAVTLGWSGNHFTAIDRLDDGRRLVHVGELFEPGEMRLSPGESYQSPLAYVAADSASLHAFVRADLIDWPGGAMRPRPVTLNTWEGNYFDHDLTALKAQASAAAALGIERFVLDDGWFGRRDDDTTSLGDWDVDPRKYPDGLGPLIDHVVSLGMEFGIWFEPEMVNASSDLFRAHPDWALQVAGRPLLPSRNQLVLDLARPEVSDYLFAKIDAVLSAHPVAYIKWDVNRDLTHAGDAGGRAATARQTRAVYALMDRIRAAHPGVEIESCASGGGRIDFGVLARTHRVWTSDCTDALERLEIQRGASRLLPPELLGAHVSASPNHQTGRILSLDFRALVALAYHLGVELNPLEMSEAERSILGAYVAAHKRLRPLLHAAGANFMLDPVDGRYAWGAADAGRIALFVAQGPQMVAEQPAPLTLPTHLAHFGGRWRIARILPERPEFIRTSAAQDRLLAGDVTFTLASAVSGGLPLPMLRPESALLIELEPVSGGPNHG
ncbi:alpha-galactosidase [Rhizobium sp. SG2393]|uniref:alpha-galactosidase n=1 Tax=Rhizobium sp. SG2393 TaxID=3276279 RepID=UPI0036730D6D